MAEPTVLIVPGLRDSVATHWQTLFEARLRDVGRSVVSVPPMGRQRLECARNVEAIEAAVQSIEGPIVIVAHSAGCIMAAHWAKATQRPMQGALLAVPPDFETPMPDGYPTLAQLQAAGWLPIPRRRLPFPSIVAASSNDPLSTHDRVVELANAWGSECVELGEVGHLNPASGFGAWPRADELVNRLSAVPVAA